MTYGALGRQGFPLPSGHDVDRDSLGPPGCVRIALLSLNDRPEVVGERRKGSLEAIPEVKVAASIRPEGLDRNTPASAAPDGEEPNLRIRPSRTAKQTAGEGDLPTWSGATRADAQPHARAYVERNPRTRHRGLVERERSVLDEGATGRTRSGMHVEATACVCPDGCQRSGSSAGAPRHGCDVEGRLSDRQPGSGPQNTVNRRRPPEWHSTRANPAFADPGREPDKGTRTDPVGLTAVANDHGNRPDIAWLPAASVKAIWMTCGPLATVAVSNERRPSAISRHGTTAVKGGRQLGSLRSTG